MTKVNNKKLERLINKAWYTDDKKKASELARQILEISPENTEALLILADNFDENDDSAREELLLRTLKSIDDENNNYSDEVKESFYISVHFRLAYTFFSLRKFNETLSSCQEVFRLLEVSENNDLIEFDIEDDLKALQYRSLIELERWHEILSMTMKDETHGLAWAYSRLIAAWKTAPAEQVLALCASMFWDALMIAPNVPFYILGYYEEPDDDESEDFVFSVLFSGIMSISEKFYHWFTRGTILFGLLTNRFDGKEREYLLDVLDSLGGYEEYEKMNSLVLEADDNSVIELLAANKCLRQ
ncbi:MAG: hypothetical protein IJR98_02005 [Synergistaceae bacterium]|nr:hypothetical protein [Synergistaceae bacterium]